MAAIYTIKVIIKTGRLPNASAKFPTIDEATAAKIKYEVTVRLIFPMLVCRSCASVVMARKKTKLLSVENQLAKAARKTI